MPHAYKTRPGDSWTYWTYGEKAPTHTYQCWLGPCPTCGWRCESYGGGWTCTAPYCGHNIDGRLGTRNPPAPDWWDTDIDVYLDGTAWCAVGAGFIDLAVSPAGFGDTPREAVAALRRELAAAAAELEEP